MAKSIVSPKKKKKTSQNQEELIIIFYIFKVYGLKMYNSSFSKKRKCITQPFFNILLGILNNPLELFLSKILSVCIYF